MTMRNLSAAPFLLVALACVAMMGACTSYTPEMQFIRDVGDALGGADDIAEAQNLFLEGSGQEFRLGQNLRPNADLTYWDLDEYRREVDLEGYRWRVLQTRTSRYLTGNPVQRQRQTIGLDGDVAYDISEDGDVRRGTAQTAIDRRMAMFHHPMTLIRLAMDETSTIGTVRQEGGQDVIDVTSADGETLSLYVDPETRHPTQIVSLSTHPNLGDVTLTTTFENYEETGGLGGFQSRLLLPQRITSMVDDDMVLELTISSDYDRELEDFAAPEDALSAPAPAFQANVEVIEVADGVWQLGGQSHHSVLVEFDEFLALIEAPQHDARTLAVIQAARDLRPEKPLQYLVNTHHHFDHSGGVRAAVSEGLTIVTHEINEAFFQDIVARPHSRQPDALAGNPQPLTMELVQGDDVYEITNGRRTLAVARITDDAHCAANLVAYLPRERLLVQADAFNPGSLMSPFAPNLLEVINDREWRVERVVPIHGAVFELSVLEELVGG